MFNKVLSQLKGHRRKKKEKKGAAPNFFIPTRNKGPNPTLRTEVRSFLSDPFLVRSFRIRLIGWLASWTPPPVFNTVT